MVNKPMTAGFTDNKRDVIYLKIQMYSKYILKIFDYSQLWMRFENCSEAKSKKKNIFFYMICFYYFVLLCVLDFVLCFIKFA